jgi:hypothetical protein
MIPFSFDLLSFWHRLPLLNIPLRKIDVDRTQSGYVIDDLPPQLQQAMLYRHSKVKQTRLSLTWRKIRQRLLDICIAMHFVRLPPYVLLEIVDFLPHWHRMVAHARKIALIVEVRRVADMILARRNEIITL